MQQISGKANEQLIDWNERRRKKKLNEVNMVCNLVLQAIEILLTKQI